jgi:hypothetical protein
MCLLIYLVLICFVVLWFKKKKINFRTAMKRAQQKSLDEKTRLLKKGRIAIAPLAGDSFSEAMRGACVREGEPLSNQPLIVNALDSGCWLSEQVAYWPANEEIGRRVYEALQDEDGMHHDTDQDTTIHLILAFMTFDKHKKRLCKLLAVSSLSELGVLRHVGGYNGKKHVDAALLDVRQFRLDVQY